MELLVVIAIIGLLSAVAAASLSRSRAKARDAKRKADLRVVDQAIQLWVSSNPGAGLPGGAVGWCARLGSTTYTQVSAALVPKYLVTMPHDPTYNNMAGDYYYYNIDNLNNYALFSVLESSSDSSYHNYTINPNNCAGPPELPASSPQFNYIIGPCKTHCTKS